MTAGRRSEDILEVPQSVVAIDKANLDMQGAKDILDVGREVPGLTFTPIYNNASVISIRGISNSPLDPVGPSPTGVYINDTPIQARYLGAGGVTTNAYPVVFDVDRVEVLRGPQGTLFGAGAEGGVIRFITPQPDLTDFSQYVRAELGSTENGASSSELGSAIGGPIVTDSLGFRISAYFRDDGGWIARAPYPSYQVNATDINWQNTTVVDAAVTWKPNDSLAITPNVYYQHEHWGDESLYWLTPDNLSNPSAGRFLSGRELPQPATDQFVLPTLQVQWDLPGMTLFSNTSYLDRTYHVQFDWSESLNELLTGTVGLPVTLARSDSSNPQDSFSQELRLQSASGNQRLTWLVGAFYQDTQQDAKQYISDPQVDQLTEALFGATVAEIYGIGALPGGVVFYALDHAEDKQTAGFAQADFKLTRTLRLTAGVRVAGTSFRFTNMQGGPFNNPPTGGSGSQSQTPVTPKFGFDYKPADNLMYYVSATKGFRLGGGNTPVPAALCASDLAALGLKQVPDHYQSDYVWSYEAGAKGSLPGGRLQFAGSVFYIDWYNVQTVVPLNACDFEYIANVESAVSRGFDLDAMWKPVDSVTVGASVTRTNAAYSKTLLSPLAANGTQVTILTDGQRLPTAPWHLNLRGESVRSRVFSGAAAAYFHADYDYQSGYNSSNPMDFGYDPEANHVYTTRLLNARLGIRSGRWDVSLFGKNVLNSHDILYSDHGAPTSSRLELVTFRPLTVGLTASYRP